jgi:hypothetical protein
MSSVVGTDDDDALGDTDASSERRGDGGGDGGVIDSRSWRVDVNDLRKWLFGKCPATIVCCSDIEREKQ